MGSVKEPETPGVGEWHMHCHVLNHMMEGMKGSLLVVRGGEIFAGLPSGEPCEMAEAPRNTIIVKNTAFAPATLAVAPGTTAMFDVQEANHTVMTVANVNADPITVNNGGGPGEPVPSGTMRMVTISGLSGGQINYQCGIHGAFMSGRIDLI